MAEVAGSDGGASAGCLFVSLPGGGLHLLGGMCDPPHLFSPTSPCSAHDWHDKDGNKLLQWGTGMRSFVPECICHSHHLPLRPPSPPH